MYNAGTDTLIGDPLGNLQLTKECHIKRDDYIIGLAIRKKIPVVMVLSGGYQKSNAEVIAASLKNLYNKYNFTGKNWFYRQLALNFEFKYIYIKQGKMNISSD